MANLCYGYIMMNERIKELATQAYQVFDKRDENYDDMFALFAELIIKECVRLIEVRKDIAIDSEMNVDEAMSTAVMDIEDFFGGQ
jgi:hypothetical protein